MVFHEAFWLFGNTEEHVALYASHKGFAFASRHSASGSIWYVEHLGQMDCTVFPYALIWVGLPFLDFWREFFVTWVTFISLTCLCLRYQFLSQEEFELQILGGFLCRSLQGLAVLSVLNPWVGDGYISEVEHGTNSPLLGAAGHSVVAEHSIAHINPPMFLLYSATTAGLGTWIFLFSFFDHLEQVSWGSIPWTVDAMTTGLLSTHLVSAISWGLRTVISDDPLPFLLRTLSAVKWHSFGIRFFWIVPVAGRPLSRRASRSLMVVKYRSKYTSVPLGTVSVKRRTAFGPIPIWWSWTKVFFHW